MRGRLPTRRPLLILAALTAVGVSVTACGSDAKKAPSTSAAKSTPRSTSAVSTSPTTPPSSSATSSSPRPSSSPRTKHRTKKPSSSAAPLATRAPSGPDTLPLDLGTGDAGQVITVTARSHGSTTATVQRWKRDGKRWTQVGNAIDAYVGSGGIGRASEGSSRTPAGSFTVTQAFGANGDPGTRLPYFRTTPADYWMSSPGPKYNTHQRCGGCGYDNGVNERLAKITPYYNYAAVIDYNTANAPGGVRQGAGSAFFLHVAVGEPTAGCVAIPQDRLVALLQWLNPDKHPRILIGVT